MNEPMNARVIRRRLTVRLDTVLLLMTLAAVAAAYYRSNASRVEWQSRLNRIETSSGLPRVHDVLKLEVAECRRTEEELHAWMVWVPVGQSCRIRTATIELVEEFPSKFEEHRLTAGRHRIAVVCDRHSDHAELTIDSKNAIERERTSVSLPGDYLRGYVQPSQPKPELIFRALGNVRLKADEEYDPVKHRFGLQVWVVP